jgi:hypothetical protein
MTATERQRRWRQQKRLAQAAENEAPAPAVETEPEPEHAPERVIVPAQLAAHHRLVEALKAQLEERTAQLEERTEEWEQACRERDDACRERGDARRERDEARKGVIPKFKQVEGQIRESWCMFCLRGQAQVDMIVATDVELRLGICFNCIERCNRIVAEKRSVSRV